MQKIEATSSKVDTVVFTIFVALTVIALLIQGFEQLASPVISVFRTVGLLF